MVWERRGSKDVDIVGNEIKKERQCGEKRLLSVMRSRRE